MKKIRDTLAEKLSLPKDVMLDLPRVSICGDKEIYVENHKGIMEYTNTCLRIKTNDGLMCIYGAGLRIVVLESDRMVINGDLERVEYEKIGRKIKNVKKNL